MSQPAPASGPLRARAEGLARRLPPLLVRAERLAAGVLAGDHGRRRPGPGDAFWQYRPAQPGDAASAIDWRRSARADRPFVQQREHQAAQAVMLWVDDGAAMGYRGPGAPESKAARARLLALALAVGLVRGGERVGLAGQLAPAGGQVQLARLATALAAGEPAGAPAGGDHAPPPAAAIAPRAQAVFLSDFLGETEALSATLARLAGRGVRGALVQVLDPVEEAFPFDGRTIFESMSGATRFETRRAGDLRARYLDRLAGRKALLAQMARRAGWHYHLHHTDAPPAGALLWLWQALGGGR